MSSKKERMQILEMIESGQLSTEDGIRLLNALGPEQDEPVPQEFITEKMVLSDDTAREVSNRQPLITDELAVDQLEGSSNGSINGLVPPSPNYRAQPETGVFEDSQLSDGGILHGEFPASDAPPAAGLPPDARKWKGWWTIPLWIGVAITVSGGFLMYTAIENSGVSLGFFCAGVPFLIGLALLVLAWQSRTAPWMHLRVQQRPGERPQRIAFSFPIPIRPTVWLVRMFGGHVRELEKISLDEMLLAVGDTATSDNPIYIKVDEGDQGEKVEIYIG